MRVDFISSFVRGRDSPPKRTIVLAAVAAIPIAIGAVSAAAQGSAMGGMPPPIEIVYVCPLDRSIRSLTPGDCSVNRQRAELVAEVPEPLEYPLTLTTIPANPRPGESARLRFEVRDPWADKIVDDFLTIHESRFHTFIVSEDLEYFLHDHPRRRRNAFELRAVLPKPGLYRVLVDFLPDAATPQLLTRSIFASGPPGVPRVLSKDYEPKQATNLTVQFSATPETPIAGEATTLRFQLSPADGIEPYFGVLGHMLVVSQDLVDMIHAHPETMQLSETAEFKLVFPRATAYRVWAQFQRDGVVNTVHFDVPVSRATN
jgi:hypothetical protein